MVRKIAFVAVVLALIAAVGTTYYYYSGGDVRAYVTTGNPDPLYLTVSSVMLHSKSGAWITVSNSTTTVQLNSNLSFLSSARVPAGNYTEVRLFLKSAQATIGSINVSVSIPNGEVIIPVTMGGLYVAGGSTAYLAIIIGPHLVSTANGYTLSPVITAKQIKAP